MSSGGHCNGIGESAEERKAHVQTKLAELSHLDLLYASPVTAGLLIEAGAESPEDGWMIPWGERYEREDTLGWFVEVLADEEGADVGDTGLPDEVEDS